MTIPRWTDQMKPAYLRSLPNENLVGIIQALVAYFYCEDQCREALSASINDIINGVGENQ